jgi:cobaltochelatase CobT
MTTSTVHTQARLGLVLTGTNEDLILPLPESKGSGDGESEEEEGEESSEDEDGTGSEDSDDTEEADDGSEDSGEGSEEADDGAEGEEEAPGGSDEGETEDGGDGEGEEPGQPGGDSEGQDDAGDAEGDSEGEDTGEPGGEPGEPGEESEGTDEGREEKSDGAGGQESMDEEEARVLAQELIEAIQDGDDETGLKDNNDALGEAIDAKAEEEGEDCQHGEQVWRPYDNGKDVVAVVTGGNPEHARRIKNKVKKEISYLRSQMRSKFLQARSPRVVHGVRKGKDLSDRRLVSSVVELRSGRRPTRPDWDRTKAEDVTLAAAVVLDQSGSMGARLAAKASGAAMAIATPLDELGCPCLVVGPRSGSDAYADGVDRDQSHASVDSNGKPRFHRAHGVTIDVFKDWEEPMHRALPRFSRVQSTGGTPLSDGIQYAMQHINDRPERHRVILVVTDGQPDHPPVVRRQIRLAAEAGVHVIGVGISSGCWMVTRLFPTHVSVNKIEELPREMMKVLTAIIFPKNGKRIALDGKF